MTDRVLLLAPSRGLGGGIERYVSTIESAFAEAEVPYHRLDLLRPGMPHGLGAKLRFLRTVRQAVARSGGPVRLVLAHRNLLPAASAVRRHPHYVSTTVLLHGSELWAGWRRRGARSLRRSDLRAVAVSSYTAGAAARWCRSTVLHPGVAGPWYDELVEASRRERHPGDEIRLVTAFRLSAWREKGLDTLLEAVRLLGEARVRLTICGVGPAPPPVVAMAASHPGCRLAPDLSDHDLATELGQADLFVLCTRTRTGATGSGEGFGLALLEAQLAGTPVVAPAHGGSHDAFLPDVTGLAPVDESPGALAVVLARLFGDDRRRVELGRAAAAWARTSFAPGRYARRVVETLLPQPPASVVSSLQPSGYSFLEDVAVPRRDNGDRAVSG